MDGGAMSAEPECGFDVRAVAEEELSMDGCLVVGLAEEKDGGGRSLLFQRWLGGDLAGDRQDRLLGMDTYCISNESGATVYGGVSSWGLEGDVLVLCLSTESAEALRLGRECRFRLLVDRQSIARLVEGLSRVLSSGGVR